MPPAAPSRGGACRCSRSRTTRTSPAETSSSSGTTFDSIARRLAGYSIAQGRDDIFIVHAENQAEEIGRDAIRRGVAAGGGQVAGTASFALSQQDVIEAIPEIADNARLSGADGDLHDLGDFGGAAVSRDLLPENGIDPRRGAVHRPPAPRHPSRRPLTLSGLQNAWFALPDPGLIGEFSARYAENYGGSPPIPTPTLRPTTPSRRSARFSPRTLRTLLSAASLTQGSGLRASAALPSGFFRTGTNDRGLAVAQIQNQQVIVIDPAPRSFGGPGL